MSSIVFGDVYDPPFKIQGYSGPIKTQYWWDVFRREIEGFSKLHGNVINTNAPDGIGAIIRNTHSGSLPKREELPDFVMPALPEVGDARYEAFRRKVIALPSDARSLLSKLSSRSLTVEDIDFRKMIGPENRPLFSYALRSVLGSFSMELRGRKQSVVIEAMAEALRNSIRGCMGIFEEMAICV